MPRGRGYGVTPKNIVDKLKGKIDGGKTLYAIATESGIAYSGIYGLSKGNREPSSSTLQKLSDYFEVSVAWLRGEEISNTEPVHLSITVFDTEDVVTSPDQVIILGTSASTDTSDIFMASGQVHVNRYKDILFKVDHDKWGDFLNDVERLQEEKYSKTDTTI